MFLITGATGYSGSAVVHEFARNKVAVRVLVRNLAKAEATGLTALPGVNIVEGDMLRPDTLGPAFEGVRRLLLISSAREQLVETQFTFIDAAKLSGVEHIVKFSGLESGIGFNQEAFRGTRRHHEIERYLEQSGLAWTHIRPSQFMQMYLWEPPTIASNRALIRPMGQGRTSPVDIVDIAKVCFSLLCGTGHEGKSYDMTGPEALTMTDVAAIISTVIGQEIPYVDCALDKYMSLLSGLPLELSEVLSEVYAERRLRSESRIHLDTHHLCGVRPTTFAEFAERHSMAFVGQST